MQKPGVRAIWEESKMFSEVLLSAEGDGRPPRARAIGLVYLEMHLGLYPEGQ